MGKNIRLTSLVKAAGWAAKVCQEDLAQVLRHLPTFDDPNLIFGFDTVGDAGVYRLRDDLAIIQTVDILTPIADDPYIFGEIAAANSLSDVYVMGGKPITALNIVGFPEKLDLSMMEKMILGGTNKIKEAGAVILGGHTIKDDDLKYGLAITAIIDPQNLITNNQAKPDDKLILTKPIGTGIISTALKQGKASEQAVSKINDSMRQLNNFAAEAMVEIGVNACTDITGFGLLGHALQLAQASGVSLQINAHQVPIFPEAIEYAEKSFYPGGTKKNYNYITTFTHFDSSIDKNLQLLLSDAQTSGGLLIAVPEQKSERLLSLLHNKEVQSAKVIGEVVELRERMIYVG